MKKALLSIFFIILAVYLVLVAWVYFIQRNLIYFPDPETPHPALVGYTDMQVVSFPTNDGLLLTAWYKKAEFSKPTIVYFHGNAGNLSNHSYIARPLMDAGYGVLLVEYRGYGGNPGKPTENGLYLDGRAAIDYLKHQNINEHDLVFFGASLGTGVAVKLAGEYTPAAVILQSPYTSVVDVGQRFYWYLPVKLLAKDHFDSLKHIKKTTAPLLVIYGDKDNVIPPDMSETLFTFANEPKTIKKIPDGNHNNLIQNGVVMIVLEFLRSL